MIPTAALLLQAAAPLPAKGGVAPVDTPVKAEPMQGVWLDIFEGEQFISSVDSLPDKIASKDLPRLTLDRSSALGALSSATLAHERLVDPYTPHAYRVSFVGYRDPPKDCSSIVPPQWGCVGAGGVHPYGITVVRVRSIEDLGALALITISFDNRR